MKKTPSLTFVLPLALCLLGATKAFCQSGGPPPPPPPPPPNSPPPNQGLPLPTTDPVKVPAVMVNYAHTKPPFQGANPNNPQFGDPLVGLTQAQLASFYGGKDYFQATQNPASGLGPIFNGVSCGACHLGPTPGGSSPINTTRFGAELKGVFDPLEELGGSLLQRFSILGRQLEFVPPQATVVAQRNTMPLYGSGLIEAIPDATILAGAAASKPDGVRGRAATLTDVDSTTANKVGRFGWKAQHASLLGFAGDAFLNEVGITNRLYPTENAPNGNTTLLNLLDAVIDPEDMIINTTTKEQGIDVFADYTRLLGPPPPVPLTPIAKAGAALFQQIGCAVCHTPQMVTGANANPALHSQVVNLYSDLLLHDMGILNDGIAQGDAGTNEMKTPALWGLRASAPYLHDGRAATVDQAIIAHDGEGKVSETRYANLTLSQKQSLWAFLLSL